MTLSQYVSESIHSETPLWTVLVSLLCVALLFAGALASVSAVGGWMLDDLFSLWASDRTVPFNLAFSERILPDSNPPLYFSSLYFIRQIISDDGVAVFALNICAIVAAAASVYFPSRHLGLSGLAVAGIAAFVLSGPVLYFASEGRSYTSALSIVFVTSWYASLAIAGFPKQLSLTRSAILGCLAALTHVYAALFCGSLAAGLLALVFFGRQELFRPALVLGLSATIVFGLWLSVAFNSVENLSWIDFSVRDVLTAALSVKELALGANLEAITVIALFAFGLLNASTRSLFTAFCIAFLLFALLPIIASFVQPIIIGRYWQIGAAALPVVVTFAARIWILEGLSPPNGKRLMAGVAALCFLITSSVLGFANVLHYTALKPIWRGAEVVRPLLSHCQEAAVHVYYGNSSRPYIAWPSAMESFPKLTGASQKLFVDPQEDATPWLSAATSSCPVLGWAEHAGALKALDDHELLRLLRVEASPDDVDFVRHVRGFVILKRRSDKSRG